MAAHNWPLGDYLLARQIGNGEFGIVYEATHPTYGSCALKLILLTGPDADEKVAAERQGAILQQRFSRAHPQLVPEVFEHQPIDGYYAVAMELVRGEPLSTVIANAPVDSRRAGEIGLSIATFLDRAHQFTTEIEGLPEIIVHADLKPAHVLLMPDDGIRVLDFGIAKALAARKPATTNKWGSMQYASPERIESGHVNEHVDFWSLGVMLFELAAGYRPYRQYEASPSRLESAIRRQEPRAPLPAGIDPVLAAIVHKLLAPQLERRYRSAAAIVHDLAAFLRGEPTVAGAEAIQAGSETIRIASGTGVALPAVPVTVPTEPLPRGITPPSPARQSLGEGGPASVTALPETLTPTPAKPAPMSRRRRLVQTIAKVAVALVVIVTFAREALGIVRATQFREEVAALEFGDIASARQRYASIRGATTFGLGALKLRVPLRDRMIQLANQTIYEFRADAPALARADWDQALDALSLAREVAPGDDTVLAKWTFVRGRLEWIRARDAAGHDRAIRLLRDAARLDPSVPDPYLGLATIYAYSKHDLPALTDAIAQAEQRGHRRGRRERAEFGDLHRWLAERARARAKGLDGEERLEQLQAAEDDYGKCAEYFDDLHLGDSEQTLAACRSLQRKVAAEIDALDPGRLFDLRIRFPLKDD